MNRFGKKNPVAFPSIPIRYVFGLNVNNFQYLAEIQAWSLDLYRFFADYCFFNFATEVMLGSL